MWSAGAAASGGARARGKAFDPTQFFDHAYWTEGRRFQALGLSDGDRTTVWPDEVGDWDLTCATTGPQYESSYSGANNRPTALVDSGTEGLHYTGTIPIPMSAFCIVEVPSTWVNQDYLRGENPSSWKIEAGGNPAGADANFARYTTSYANPGPRVLGIRCYCIGMTNTPSPVLISMAGGITNEKASVTNGVSQIGWGAYEQLTGFRAIFSGYRIGSLLEQAEFDHLLNNWAAIEYGAA